LIFSDLNLIIWSLDDYVDFYFGGESYLQEKARRPKAGVPASLSRLLAFYPPNRICP
jgi:hypothetical protein